MQSGDLCPEQTGFLLSHDTSLNPPSTQHLSQNFCFGEIGPLCGVTKVPLPSFLATPLPHPLVKLVNKDLEGVMLRPDIGCGGQ